MAVCLFGRNFRAFSVVILLLSFAISETDIAAVGFDPCSSGGAAGSVSFEDAEDRGPVIEQLQFNHDEISMAFQIISDVTGWSIFPTAEVTGAKISLWARDIRAMDLLDKVVRLGGFTYKRAGDVISVMTCEEYMRYYGLDKEVVGLSHADAASVAAVITPFLTKLGRCVVHNETNTIVLYEADANLESIITLAEKLDTFVEPITRNYHFAYIDAVEIYEGVEQTLSIFGRNDNNMRSGREGAAGNSRYGRGRSGVTLVERTNSILLTGPPSMHRIMTSIVESADIPGTYEAGMIRVYKIENADVEEIAKTIQDLIRSEDSLGDKTGRTRFSKKFSASETGPGRIGDKAESEEFIPQIEARVSVNKSTNSVIIQATAREHREFEKLIAELDTRRKQVLIKAMIVEVITSDDLSVGVELSRAGEAAFAFTSFGLSTNLDVLAGTRDVTISPGATAAVVRPDKIQAILQLLQSKGNARITSAPQILVNDNAVGFINSIAEEPTTQTNQGETTTTTTFAGFVEAGTQFAITPHISENNYLRIEYQITLNSFGTRPTDPSIPPPRNTSSIQSEATVPDGFTIVVGGLETTNESENVDKVPLLGDIPIVGLAFRNTVIKKQYKTTYLFITPTIMQRADFADLKDASKKALDDVDGDDDNRPVVNTGENGSGTEE